MLARSKALEASDRSMAVSMARLVGNRDSVVECVAGRSAATVEVD